MKQYIHPKLKPFFKAIEPLEWKNCGGCLFFAYAFWLWAKKEGLDLKSFEIIQIDQSNGRDLEANVNWIETKEGYCKSSGHFVWKYHKTEYDGDGKLDPKAWYYDEKASLNGLNGRVSIVEEFCVKALKEGNWNSMFDREKAIEHLEEHLKIDLDKVKRDVDTGWI